MAITNGPGLAGLGTLKSAVYQEWIDEMSRFFACWYKFGKTKCYFNNCWVGMVKNGWSLINYESYKSIRLKGV